MANILTWKTAATSVRGTSHEALRLGNDDAFQVERLGRRSLLIAVADGAGSASHGGVGARVAVRRAVREIQKVFGAYSDAAEIEKAFPSVLALIRTQLQRSASRRGIAFRDLAATLIIVVVTGRRIIVGQIGDGAVVVQNGTGTLQVMEAGKRGEFAGETVFVTSPNVRFETRKASGVTAIAVMTDGVEHLSINSRTREPANGFFEPLFARVKTYPRAEVESALKRSLSGPGARARTDDDLTLIVAAINRRS